MANVVDVRRLLLLLLHILNSLVWAKNCSNDGQCAPSEGGFPQSCCAWDNTVGMHMSGHCAELCPTRFNSVQQICSADMACTDRKHTCCSWSTSFGIYTTGICGEVCASGSFQTPKSCTSNSDCIGPKKCCKRDGNADAKNGVCGEVCRSGGFIPEPQACSSDSECTSSAMPKCCSWDNTAGKHKHGHCGGACLHGFSHGWLRAYGAAQSVAHRVSHFGLLDSWLIPCIAWVFLFVEFV